MKLYWYSFPFAAYLTSASPRLLPPNPQVTSTSPYKSASESKTSLELGKRQTTAFSSVAAAPTCGYVTGNADLPVTGAPGDYCAIDTVNALWGICASTAAIGSSDCDLSAWCVDVLGCSTTCAWERPGGTTAIIDSSGGTISCTASGADLCGVTILSFDNIAFASLVCTTTTGSVSNYLTLSDTVEAVALFTPPPSSSPSSSSSIVSSSIPPESAVTSSQVGPTTTSPPQKSSKSSSKTEIIVGVLVSVLVLTLVGAAIFIGRYRLSQRRKQLEGLGEAITAETERKEPQASLTNRAIELPSNGIAHELEAESRPVEINTIRSPVELEVKSENRNQHP